MKASEPKVGLLRRVDGLMLRVLVDGALSVYLVHLILSLAIGAPILALVVWLGPSADLIWPAWVLELEDAPQTFISRTSGGVVAIWPLALAIAVLPLVEWRSTLGPMLARLGDRKGRRDGLGRVLLNMLIAGACASAVVALALPTVAGLVPRVLWACGCAFGVGFLLQRARSWEGESRVPGTWLSVWYLSRLLGVTLVVLVMLLLPPAYIATVPSFALVEFIQGSDISGSALVGWAERTEWAAQLLKGGLTAAVQVSAPWLFGAALFSFLLLSRSLAWLTAEAVDRDGASVVPRWWPGARN